MEASLIVAFVVATFLLSIAPGPDMLFIVAHATVGGRRAGVVAALGMSTGLAVHTAAATLGLTALLQAAPQALTGVRVAGVAFLLYLAYGCWRASRRVADSPSSPAGAAPPRRPLSKVYAMAALTNVANPKIFLFYLVFLPQFLSTGAGAWPVWLQLSALGLLFIIVGLPVDATVGLTAGSLAERVLHRPAFRQWLERVSAAIFGGLAVRLAVDLR